jgi:arylsulfatase A-like enzyme
LAPGAREGSAKITNGHLAAGKLRGVKGRVWEGGHRVPFIARWPNAIPAGTVSHETLGFTDMLATFAALVGVDLTEGVGADSVNRLAMLLGRAVTPRPAMVHHSSSAFALRHGKWKIVFGVGEHRVKSAAGKGYLFDLEADPSESNDLWQAYPEVVERLTEQFKTITETGRRK